MDGILPVHRGSDVISVMFCKLGKFILVDFKKELCPEKDNAALIRIVWRTEIQVYIS